MSGTDISHSEYVGGLFRHHYGWLCERLRRYSGVSAEDIAAEVFAQLLASPGVVPIREPRALLTTIAQRLLYQFWRRRKLEQRFFDGLHEDFDVHQISPEDGAQALEALQAVDVSLDSLPKQVKATFLLSQINGLTYPQIAAELGICQRSVSVYMTKAFTRCMRA
ncbi:sigma-70 family RNA polymerase sigma factor [Pseudomonas sp. NA-150]|uniref:sigma-70 family RNA polymerase sigma factor n=1 Tax=Pseudomonas sp. NA-150 TaxID=3367525 RepID=UPI0037C90E9B